MHVIRFLVVAATLILITGGFAVAAGAQSQGTRTPIKHVVILMMENHSFDNLFGIYGKLANGSMAAGVTVPLNLISGNHSASLRSVSSAIFSTPDPYEGYNNYHIDWNNGKMNGFLNGSGPNSLTYFTASQVAPEWGLAQQYSLADMYFSETLSETLPNRLYSLTGFSPVKSDQLAPPPYALYNQSIFGEMDKYGVSWSYYLQKPSAGIYPLNYISGISGHSSNIGSWNSFVNSVSAGNLPSVSWVSSISGGANGYSQHPSANILAGEMWMLYIVHLIMQSPIWNSTAIMITYDEGGGYYDQIAPPSVSGKQLGIRVPFILVSPYAKEDYVSGTVMTHTSILGFIDYNWNMPALNSLVLHSNLPLDMFNFNTPYSNGTLVRPPMAFNSTQLALLPSDLQNSTVHDGAYTNVSSLFPFNFQYITSGLPYSTTGSTTFNLSQLSGNVYVAHDISYVPSQQAPMPYYVTAAVIAIPAVFLVAILLYLRRRMGK